MAKDNKNRNENKGGYKGFDIDREKDLLRKDEAKLKKRRALLVMACDHTKKNGELRVDQIDKNRPALVRCTKCGEKFSIAPIDNTDLTKAIKTIKNAINQCKIDSVDNDGEMLETLGHTYSGLDAVEVIYANLVATYGKKKKNKNKKNKNRDSFGHYGSPFSR